ncbi:MAG: hypothetical protein KDK36_19670 [Leptospiraceae bacterium]|nr:hypothetical protein [Leptospiraceae bacterium]
MFSRVLFIIVIGFILPIFPIFAKGRIKVACIGDSITYGGGIKNRIANSYPAQLQKILGKEYKVKNFGVGGATMLRKGDIPYWKEDEFMEALQFAPDIIIIKFGTNDSKTIHWNAKAYKENYNDFITIFKKIYPEIKIYIALPIPAFKKIWNIQPEVIDKEIPPILEEISEKENVGLINLYSVLLPYEEYFFDKIHPDARGAKLIAETIAEKLKEKTAKSE